LRLASNQKADRFVDLVAKWHLEEREADRKSDAAKFDFLNNPGKF